MRSETLVENCRLKFSILFVFVIIIFPHYLRAYIADFDEVWQERAKEAKKGAYKAYRPHPEKVTQSFNYHVHKDLERSGIGNRNSNSTNRRNLRSHRGPCVATNPIDRCWRCDKNWAKHRKRLAKCALGFGQGTTGGKDGKIYVVTDPSDDDLLNPKPGTLRYGVIQPEPLWIIFARDMIIRLAEELMVSSNKTIDGRGARVHICNGGQITIQFVENVILHGLHIHDIKAGNGGLVRDSVEHYGFRTRSDGDGISVFGSSRIWIDHISMSNCQDGLIDVIMASTAVTISNCHFTHHNEVMLFGASDGYSEDQVMQVTVAFNHFGQGLVQRMPRCRWGFIHVVNNDYTHWLMYAIGGSQHPTIISQGNRFIAPRDINCKEVTKRDYSPESVWKTWNWRSEGDLLMNGAFFVESGNPVNNIPKKGVITAKPGSFVTRLTRFSGALNCVKHKPC
ncbi:Pectate lyase [Parasponia andersonii]|uniref:Pectate lyase n=1 Tax=Parasponia andersonii TaxID=3476 RepID=A0A2P5A5L5_PARAD|nr:Pectate lyase [Parasponia andersonii]